MHKIVRVSLSLLASLSLSSCWIFGANPTAAVIAQSLRLGVQTQNGANTYSHVGEIINYTYAVSNVGTTPLP